PACTTAPSFTLQPPASVTVNEGGTLALSAGVRACGATFQWTKNNTAVTGANNPAFTLNNVTPGDAGDYRLIVTNPIGRATSDVAHVTINADLVKPTVVSVSGGTDPTTVTITFSKVLGAATAQATANYS